MKSEAYREPLQTTRKLHFKSKNLSFGNDGEQRARSLIPIPVRPRLLRFRFTMADKLSKRCLNMEHVQSPLPQGNGLNSLPSETEAGRNTLLFESSLNRAKRLELVDSLVVASELEPHLSEAHTLGSG